ncbi:hypothetical protein, partial [Longispora fulva]|uniref:hypothetical protein n=1 Tax=Longispora fulva TaxID=619741 RepID=UPI003640016F
MEQVLLPQLEEMDTIHVAVDFNENKGSLTGNINLPYIQYMGIEVDSLRFNVDSDRDQLSFHFGLDKLDAGPLAIRETILKGDLKNEILG